jgi:hypothetical protein
MKLDNRILSLALAASTRRGPLNAAEKNARLYLAQHMWDHPTGLKQQLTAADLLELGEIPAEEWPDPLPDERTAFVAYERACRQLLEEPMMSRLRHFVMLRRQAWAARIYAAVIEKDLQDAVRTMENAGGRLTIVDKTKVAPVLRRRYVVSSGRPRKLNLSTTEKSE